jgi:hypothetical protein
VRVRIALGVAVAVVAAALVVNLSRSAPRLAGTDYADPDVFAANVPAGAVHGRRLLCQAGTFLPGDAGSALFLVGSYGKPLPAVRLSFSDAGRVVAAGSLPAATHEGPMLIRMSNSGGDHVASTMCLSFGAGGPLVLGGVGGGAGAATVDGQPQGGRVSVIYYRRGSESWWQLLGAVDRRFGIGRASFFGAWTLPVLALVLLSLWVFTVRFLGRMLKGSGEPA